MGRVEGKVAIVTGAASGLGEATAKLFAQEGAKVVVADVHEPHGAEVVSAIKESGGEAMFAYTDVTKAEDVKQTVQTAEERYGKLDIMIANAGIMGSACTKSAEEITEEEWDLVININLTGVLRSFKHAIPAIRRAGGGAMSATASVAGVARVGETQAAYNASKAGVVALVKQVAYEVMDDNIRVNCVCPGGMDTRIFETQNLSAAQMEAWQARRQAMRKEGRRGVMVNPMEMAYSHLFLCSDEAAFITGQPLVVDAGFLIRSSAQ